MQNINRRNFIGKTALAGIGIAGAGAMLSSCRREKKDDKEHQKAKSSGQGS